MKQLVATIVPIKLIIACVSPCNYSFIHSFISLIFSLHLSASSSFYLLLRLLRLLSSESPGLWSPWLEFPTELLPPAPADIDEVELAIPKSKMLPELPLEGESSCT